MRAMLLVVVVVACSTSTAAPTKDQLGKLLFEDPNLSDPPGQACADCHAANSAFRDPESDHSSSMGVIPGRFGARNAPTLMYARFIPPLHREPSGWVGGLFWDGRASSLEDQVAGPMLNPLEMNNKTKASVVARVRSGSYAGALRDVFGAGVLDDDDRGYAAITAALAAYERSPELAPFSSRYDAYLAGEAKLTPAESRGLSLFESSGCATCHPNRPGLDGSPPLFTTFGYANVGVPRYPNNKFYVEPRQWNADGSGYVDRGLGAVVGDAKEDGKFRVPTLRDIARTAPYGHNGYFANLPFALEFITNREVGSYDVATCDRLPGAAQRCAWPAAEVAATVDPWVGKLDLTPDELADLDAFLVALDDPPSR
jgi:cytochrome c peroxidase